MRDAAAVVLQQPYRVAALCFWSLVAVAAPSSPAPFTMMVRLTPASLTFGTQEVGTSSASEAVTLRNLGAASLTVVKPAASGDFCETDTCSGEVASNASCTINITFTPTNKGTSLTPGVGCTINVTFTPRRAGSSTAWLIVSDDGGGSPQRVTLWGVGLQ